MPLDRHGVLRRLLDRYGMPKPVTPYISQGMPGFGVVRKEGQYDWFARAHGGVPPSVVCARRRDARASHTCRYSPALFHSTPRYGPDLNRAESA